MVEDNLKSILKELPPEVKLVAVSKFHPASDIQAAYNAGQRRFGENRPQEFAAKVPSLPDDIEWHFIGHLQTNKLKFVLPYASLVESIDSLHLLGAVEKWGSEHGKVIDVLLDQAVVEADFARIEAFKKLLDEKFQLPDFTELSIGMSHDWPLAVKHGATIVRIGTAIFGPRTY